jgi:hypothetical protein
MAKIQFAPGFAPGEQVGPQVSKLARAKQRAKRQVRAQRKRRREALIRNPRVQFADWLKRKLPEVYAVAEQSAQGQMELLKAKAAGVSTGNQLGFLDWDVVGMAEPVTTATTEKSTWQKFLDGAITAGTSYLTLKNQRDMLELNIERAKAGQPPLDAATTAPVIRTQVDIDPTLARSLASDVGAGINRNMMIFGGLALVVLFFMMRK